MDQAKDNEKGEHRMDALGGCTSPYSYFVNKSAVVVALILASISAWHAP